MNSQYKFIVNPLTGRKVKVNGKIGSQLIKNYLKHIMTGGAVPVVAQGENFIFVVEYGGSGIRLHIFKVDSSLSSFESVKGATGELEIRIEKPLKTDNIHKSGDKMRDANIEKIIDREVNFIKQTYRINKIYVLCFVSGGHISKWGNSGRGDKCVYPFIKNGPNSNITLENNKWFKLFNNKETFVRDCAPRYISTHLNVLQELFTQDPSMIIDNTVYVDEGVYETLSVLNNFLKTKEGRREKKKVFLVLLCGSTTIQISLAYKTSSGGIIVRQNYTFDYQRSPENPYIYFNIISALIDTALVERAISKKSQIKVMFNSNYAWVLPKCGKRYRDFSKGTPCSSYFVSNLSSEIGGWNDIEIDEELITDNCANDDRYYTRQDGRPSESMVMALKVLKNKFKFSKFTVFKDLYYWDPNAINKTDRYVDGDGLGEWKLMSIGPHHGVILDQKNKIISALTTSGN